jgi:hypothetical protein
MKVKPLPSRERLDELLIFNEHTGEIRWKVNGNNQFIKVGKLAGTIVTHPTYGKQYRVIAIDGIRYYAHRLARFYYYGDQPIEVDHKNGDSLDNRKDNLRASNRKHNTKNCKMQKNNTSGVIGVTYHKRDKLWYAKYGGEEFIKKHGTLKDFEDFFEAVCCRKSWECKYGMDEIKKHRKD